MPVSKVHADANGHIPEDWGIDELKNVIQNIQNLNPIKEPEKRFKYIDVSCVSNVSFRIVDHSDQIAKSAPSRARKIVRHNDVLFATVRPSLKRIAHVPIDYDCQVCSTGFCVIRPEPTLANSRYLYYHLLQDEFVRRVSELERGSSYPAVSDGVIYSQFIFLPPLPEQENIATVLSAVQEAKEKTEGVIRATKELKKSLMKHLFTYGPVSIKEAERVPLEETDLIVSPNSWMQSPIGNYIELAQYGLSQRGEQEGQYPILRMNCLMDGRVQSTNLQYVDLKEKDLSKFRLNKSDILFNRTNSYELVGKTSLFDLDGDYVFASYLIRMRTKPHLLLPEYLNYYLNWDATQRRLKFLASRGVSQSNINATKLKGLAIAIPPLLEQQQIVGILSSIDQKLQAEETNKAALDTLFKTLLHNLMSGKIRVKDINLKKELEKTRGKKG